MQQGHVPAKNILSDFLVRKPQIDSVSGTPNWLGHHCHDSEPVSGTLAAEHAATTAVDNKASAQESREMTTNESQERLSTEEVQQLASIVDQCEHLDNALLDTRLDLIKTLETYTPEELSTLEKTHQEYALSPESKKTLESLGIDHKIFDVCTGDIVQQKVHQEFVSIVDLASMIYEKAQSVDIKELIAFTIEFATTGSAFNQQGEIKRALSSADCSWSLLNCTKVLIKTNCYIALGFWDGVDQSIDNALHVVTHPAQTAKEMLKAIWVAGYYIGKLTYEELISKRDLVFGLYNEEYFEKYCRDVQQKNDAIIALADQAVARIKESSVRDISREITVFGADWYFTGKALSTVGKFLKLAKIEGTDFAKKIKQAVPRPIAVTAEGIPIQTSIAEHAKQALSNFMESAGEKLREAFGLLPESTKVLVTELKIATEAVREEIPVLRNLFDGTRKGFGEFATKYIKIPYEHILSIEYFAEGSKFKWSGFHHDFMGKIEKSGIAQFSKKVMGKNGCYKAYVKINGITKETTFFPQKWTREKNIRKVLEAYDNFIASGAKNFARDGKYFLKNCFTNEGIEIELYITKNGRITSGYPKV